MSNRSTQKGSATVAWTLACVAAGYLGVAFAAYRSWVGARLDLEDPWLNGLSVAWPFVVAALALKWFGLLLVAALVLVVAATVWDERRAPARRAALV